MKKIFNFFFLFLVLVGCAKKPNPPKWLLNHPNDDSKYLYATAQAFDKDTAIEKALNNIAAKLKVTLNSQTILNKGVFKNQYYRDFYQEIDTKVDDIDIPEYKVIKTSKDDIYTYVLVRVDKEKLKKYLYSKILDSLNQLELKAKNTTGAFKKVILGYRILNKLIKIEQNIQILSILNVNTSLLDKKVKELYNRALKLKNIPFKILVSNFHYKNSIKEVMSKYLNIKNDSENFVKFIIYTNANYLMSQFIVYSKVNINFNNEISKNLNIVGKAYTSNKDAYFNANKDLKKKLDKLMKNILLKDNHD